MNTDSRFHLLSSSLMISLAVNVSVWILSSSLVACGVRSNIENNMKIDNNSYTLISVLPKLREGKHMLEPKQIISAEVLLCSASGATINGNTIITSQNMARYSPSYETVKIVSQYFESNGFQITPIVGIAFTISATVEHFSQFFNASLTMDDKRGVRVVSNPQTTDAELSLDSLPGHIANLITAITFMPPPTLFCP